MILKKSALVQKLSLSDCSILICVHFMHTMHYSPNLVKVYGYFHQRWLIDYMFLEYLVNCILINSISKKKYNYI